MVDFNNDTTIGTPASDVEKISILQRRYDFIEAWEDYKKKKYRGIASPTDVIKVRLMSLFLEIQAMLKRRQKAEDYKDLYDKCMGGKDDKAILEAFITINEFIDVLRLTRIDTQKIYDSLDVEAENMEKGY